MADGRFAADPEALARQRADDASITTIRWRRCSRISSCADSDPEQDRPGRWRRDCDRRARPCWRLRRAQSGDRSHARAGSIRPFCWGSAPPPRTISQPAVASRRGRGARPRRFRQLRGDAGGAAPAPRRSSPASRHRPRSRRAAGQGIRRGHRQADAAAGAGRRPGCGRSSTAPGAPTSRGCRGSS